jgi:hypothetical protein
MFKKFKIIFLFSFRITYAKVDVSAINFNTPKVNYLTRLNNRDDLI